MVRSPLTLVYSKPIVDPLPSPTINSTILSVVNGLQLGMLSLTGRIRFKSIARILNVSLSTTERVSVLLAALRALLLRRREKGNDDGIETPIEEGH